MNKLLALLLSLLLAVGSPAGTLAEATASEPAIQEDGVIENEGVLPPEETVPPEEVTLPNESGDTPEDDGVLPQESDQEELDGDALPDEESSESLPDDGGFVWDEAHPLKSAVEIFGSVYALTVTETPVYSAADMTDTIFTVFSGCVLLATGYDEEQAAVEVWLIAETGETLNGYVYENALSQTVMTYEDALTTSDELRSFSVPTDAGELPVFVVMGTKPEDSIAQPDEQGDSVTDGFSGNPPQNDEPEETPPPELAVIPDSSETPADTATLFVPVTTPEETSPAPTATPALDDENALLLDGEDLLNDYGIMPINAPYPSGAYLGASVQVTTNKKYHNTVPDIVLLGDDEQNCDIHKTSDGGYVYCLENNKDSPGNESSGEYESYEVMDWLTYSQRATGHHSLWSASTWHALAAVAHKGYHHGTVITGSSKQAEGNTATAKDLYNFGGTQIAMRCVTNEIEGDGSTRGWDIDNISSNYRNGGPSNADDDIASLYADALMYVREFLYEGSYSYHFDITISGNVVSGPTRRSDGNYDVTISLTPSHSYQYDYGISADHVVSVNGRSYADEDNWYHVNSTSSTGATQVNLVVDTLPCTISFGTLGSSSYEDGFYIGVPRDNYNAQAVMILISSGPVVIGGADSINLETPSGSINVTKQSAGGALLPGATFELLSSGGGVLQSQTTDGSGSVTFSDLDPGSYTVKEKGAPEGYRVAVPDTQGATVTAGQTSNLTFRNDEKTAKIKIVKTDRISHAPLAGAQFTVTRLSGPAGYTGGVQTVATLTTGPDGTAETDWLGYGRYRVEETAAPENYVSSHFSQEIDAFEDGKTYTFSVENEPLMGYIRLTKSDSLDQTPIEGVQFDIFDSHGTQAGSMTTGANGIATSGPLTKGQYTVKEHSNPEGYVADLVTLDAAVIPSGTTDLSADNQPIQGKIRIVKKDQLTKEALAGAEFTVTRIEGLPSHKGAGNGETVAVVTTDADGIAETPLLTYGKYRVAETKVPEHFVDNAFSTEISINNNMQTYEIEVENEPTKGYIQLTKSDSLDQTPIKGVQFDIFDSNGEQVGSMTTGADGVATSEPLTKGKYTVKEHADPEGYVAELVTQDAVVKSDETTTLHADNQPIQGKIRIVKKDQLTKEALAGAEFTVTRISGLPSHKGAGNGETVAVVTTGADGIAETPLLTYGKYRVTETKVPEHFVDNSFSTEVEIREDNLKTYEIEVENEPTKGYIQLTKSDSLDQTPIEGVQFDIFDSNGEQVGSMTTGADGVATSEPLTKGKYTVKEHADPEGYVAELVTEDAVVKSDETTTLHADNQPIQGKIRIVKKDQLTKEALAGAEFTVTRIEGLPSHKGVGNGETVAVVTTGADGIAETPLLTYGKYRVAETKVPEHFVDNSFSTEVEIRDDNLKTYEIEVENEPTTGYIQLTKSDRLDQTPIEDVQFDIYYNDGYGSGLAGTMTTGEDGTATSSSLRKGKYLVKEHADPEGYVAELVTQDAVVKSDETTMLHADNQPIQGKIRIVKKDQLTKEALAGAEFTVTRIEGLPSHKGVGNGETVAVVTTGADGIAETPLLTYGKYRVTETKVPEHFVDNSFSTEVEIRDDNLKTYEIEVENEPTKGWLRLTKRDRQNGNPIEGVQFDIYYNDQYGEGLAGTMTTGADGVATSEPLRKGKYLVREHGATPGYLFEEIEMEASVRSDEITELEATNRHVTVKLRLLKRDADEYAGDSGNTSTRGDGVLSGAEFQVLAGEDILDRQGNVVFTKGAVVVESLKTEGDAASVTTDELWPGLYEIVELSPPTGYQPSDEHVLVDARDPAGQSAEAVVTYEGVKTNEIKLGAKAIVKTLGTDQGEVGDGRLETPEAGAEFDVYLKKAGSYENAREFERDHLVTDKNGYAMTKPLPYGVYTLRQTKGEAGYEIKAPIDFFIDGSENLVNPPVMSLSDRPILYRIKLVKQDAETGNTVPLAGASFKLRDGNGDYVTQTVFYPREQRIDTFTTDETGSVTLPETVRWGAYSIEEIHAPEGYLLPDAEISIFVGRDGDTPDEVYELEYTVQDAPVKGRLVLEKRGKQLSGFEEVEDAYGNTLHHPVFEDGYLAGATFELRAAADIRGGDDTLWFSAGELADTLATTADGPVESKALPLGRYTLTEISSPDGYALSEAPQEIELAYADDQTSLVEVRATVRNEYMPVEVSLEKVAETLETFADGNTVHETVSRAPGEGFVFGLFADQDFQCGDGILYADSLVATGVTGADGTLTFSGHYPHGRYYVKELSAPDGWKVNPEKSPVSLTPDIVNEDGVIRTALPEPVFDEMVYSRITLTKEDITGEHTLPDTMIELRDENDRVVWRDYTDENGNLPDIPVVPGTYTFREVLAPNGYELNVAEMAFAVDERGGVTGDTVVRDDYTRFFLLKQDENGEPLAGVEFGLFKEDGALLMTAVTDEDGLATFEKVPYGDYTIVETKPLPGYLKSGTQVHLSVDGRFINPSEPIATVTNEKLRMRGKKVDTSGNPLAGAEFVLIDAEGYVIQSAVSDENGEFIFEGIPYGDWVIRETIAPEGFSRMDDRLLHIDESWTEPEQTFTFVDIPNHYEFVKVDGHNDPLPGVKFALEDAEGNVLRELASGEDGIVHVDDLAPGSYIIRETEALDGYTLTDETIELTIDERYVAPEKLKRIKNYSDIQTGVDFPITPLTVAGAGMVLASVLLTVAYRVETREKRRHLRRKKKASSNR